MDILVKFIDGEKLVFENVSSFAGTDDYWKITVGTNENNLFFNKSLVKYIGRKYYLMKGERNDDR